jgi:hypothetical protein
VRAPADRERLLRGLARGRLTTALRVDHRPEGVRVREQSLLPGLLGDLPRGNRVGFGAVVLAQQRVRLGEHDVDVRERAFVAQLPPALDENLVGVAHRRRLVPPHAHHRSQPFGLRHDSLRVRGRLKGERLFERLCCLRPSDRRLGEQL